MHSSMRYTLGLALLSIVNLPTPCHSFKIDETAAEYFKRELMKIWSESAEIRNNVDDTKAKQVADKEAKEIMDSVERGQNFEVGNFISLGQGWEKLQIKTEYYWSINKNNVIQNCIANNKASIFKMAKDGSGFGVACFMNDGSFLKRNSLYFILTSNGVGSKNQESTKFNTSQFKDELKVNLNDNSSKIAKQTPSIFVEKKDETTKHISEQKNDSKLVMRFPDNDSSSNRECFQAEILKAVENTTGRQNPQISIKAQKKAEADKLRIGLGDRLFKSEILKYETPLEDAVKTLRGIDYEDVEGKTLKEYLDTCTGNVTFGISLSILKCSEKTETKDPVIHYKLLVVVLLELYGYVDAIAVGTVVNIKVKNDFCNYKAVNPLADNGSQPATSQIKEDIVFVDKGVDTGPFRINPQLVIKEEINGIPNGASRTYGLTLEYKMGGNDLIETRPTIEYARSLEPTMLAQNRVWVVKKLSELENQHESFSDPDGITLRISLENRANLWIKRVPKKTSNLKLDPDCFSLNNEEEFAEAFQVAQVNCAQHSFKIMKMKEGKPIPACKEKWAIITFTWL